jgi:hypothetical protein
MVAPAKMNSSASGVVRHEKALRAWQLALLRFAVTLDDNDRLAVLATAVEIDRLGSHGGRESDFRFFRRTSAELCASISDPGNAGSQCLHQYLAQIDDERLKRSFAAAIEYRLPEERPPVSKPTGRNDNLWRGLSPRPLSSGSSA